MTDTELKEIARGHIRVKVGAKSVTVYGEALLRGGGSPYFVLYENSIERWNAPNGDESENCLDKDPVIRFLKEEFGQRKLLLEIK